jgi:DNA-binding XRE family transcriptional regulator
MTPAEQFGRKLFMARRRLGGVSQEALAHSAGLNRCTVYLLENGKRTPTLTTIVALAHALEIDPAKLVKGLRPPVDAVPFTLIRPNRSGRAEPPGAG